MKIDRTTMELARFAAGTRFIDIPDDVLEFAKSLLLKTLAGMLVGSDHEASRKFAAIVRNRKLPTDATVLGANFKTSLWEAVLLNAFSAHASELEDDKFDRNGGGVSWDITVIPALVSLAEVHRVSGRQLLESIAVGLEVHARTNIYSAQHLALHCLPGAVGPAVAVAHLLKLNADQIANAMGLAMSAPANWEGNFGTDAHFYESAVQSMQGLIAGEMAREGMTGAGQLTAYLTDIVGEGKIDDNLILRDLGKVWEMKNIWVKKYPVCFANHRYIDLLLGLQKEHDFHVNDVDVLELHTSPAEDFCNRPEPTDVGGMQFSFQHALGVALVDRDVNFIHLEPEVLRSEKYQLARKKVKIVQHNDRSHIVNVDPAEIVVKLKDGRTFQGKRQWPVGAPEEPLTSGQVHDLFRKFARNVLVESKVEWTIDYVADLEQKTDIHDLLSELKNKF
ncbi:MmgE/PrpD family protein [Pelagibacterium lacus]|uniref:MmgE/PrpD family protein n=1 Tax=Pelagibacterium lacus TaxID=2282655 RepID=A0A369W1Z8_9HYPH|nr:MmgE/PrpD family protein [Pelagibacterium lacus]RDE08706.1 hypothetical protein DVH29_10455 [Pelagibacterium lacus]